MSDLDQKLREIIFEIRTDIDYDSAGNRIPETKDSVFVAAIKQVLKDEGYVQAQNAAFIKGTKVVEYITGQEWLSRFERELKLNKAKYWNDEAYIVALAAARKASNLPAAPDTP